MHTVLLAYISAVDRAVTYCGCESPHFWASCLVKVFQDLWPDLATGESTSWSSPRAPESLKPFQSGWKPSFLALENSRKVCRQTAWGAGPLGGVLT